MNLDFSDEQDMLRRSACEFIKRYIPKTFVKEMEDDPTGFTDDIWKEMVQLGWPGWVVPEEYGGVGGSFMDIMVLLEEMGNGCLPSPFFSTVLLGAFPIIDAGTEEQKQKYLPTIAGGEAFFTLALTEASGQYKAAAVAATATADGDGYTINGTKLYVPDAHVANYLLCVARTNQETSAENGLTIFIVDAKSPGINCTVLKTISGEKLCEVVFDGVKVARENILGELDQGWVVVQKTIDRAAVGKCAEMLGGLDWVLENCTAYALERVQYGKVIGSYQSMQHHLAEMWTNIHVTKFLVYQAAWAIEEGIPCASQVAMAKSWASQTYLNCTKMGVQIFGAIGTTREHDMGLYYRRARQVAPEFGDMVSCRETVAQGLGL
ncbi:MAG: hypothetical protein A2Y60_06300 [Chloroflexi bacterium RBG_13_54_9]|nr:MAG: hypothetical protein A2Y60_06300 [Chloroflexi bacterium RBG_13_54_9]